jgi:hypothetical protein
VGQARAIVTHARRTIAVEVVPVHSRGQQRVFLQIQHLRTIGLGDTHVSDVHF